MVSEVAGRAALALDNARLFAELGEARAQQEAILAAIGQSVTAQDRDGRLLFANQAAASILGAASPAELLTWTPGLPARASPSPTSTAARSRWTTTPAPACSTGWIQAAAGPQRRASGRILWSQAPPRRCTTRTARS